MIHHSNFPESRARFSEHIAGKLLLSKAAESKEKNVKTKIIAWRNSGTYYLGGKSQ